MNNRKVTNILLAVLIVFNVGFVGSWWFGHWKAHRMGRMGHDHFEHETKGAMFLMKELNFSESQKAQLEALRNNHFHKVEMLEAVVLRNQKGLMNALIANPSDSVRANMYADSVGIAKAAMQKELFRHLDDIKKMCNPDQSRKFDELVQEMSKEFPHHMGMHGQDDRTKQDSM